MKPFVLVILFILTACSTPEPVEMPFAEGLFNIPWGCSRSFVDSVAAKDSTWKYISSIVNSTNGRQIVVLQRNEREYYLEFDNDGLLHVINYIADHADLDTVRTRLNRFYGFPVLSDSGGNGSFERSLWQDSERALEFELMVTRKSYSLVAKHKR
ncbi:MAG: hypothetical protein KDC45_03040 [Bacteroidetes bacterium]|nr:hypothetical protein [Bacteroidota bacterium]